MKLRLLRHWRHGILELGRALLREACKLWLLLRRCLWLLLLRIGRELGLKLTWEACSLGLKMRLRHSILRTLRVLAVLELLLLISAIGRLARAAWV